MTEEIIFNSNGQAVLIKLSNGNLLTYNGYYVGFIFSNKAYDFNGSHRGWFEGGILRDIYGYCVGFVRGATDSFHPVFPIPHIPPIRPITPVPPLRPLTNIPFVKPIKQVGWSDFNPMSLFGF